MTGRPMRVDDDFRRMVRQIQKMFRDKFGSAPSQREITALIAGSANQTVNISAVVNGRRKRIKLNIEDVI